MDLGNASKAFQGIVMSSFALDEVKKDLRSQLIPADRVEPHPGLKTSRENLDQFLLWQGLPQGALSLFHGRSGRGATSLWMDTAVNVLSQKKWVAWINGPGRQLNPWPLWRRHADLSRLVVISAPQDRGQLLWVLQEVMSLSLFDLIGCDLGSQNLLREQQLLRLKRQARAQQTALVFISQLDHVVKSSSYSLILNFKRQHLHVDRALHRLTPHLIKRRSIYADLMPQLAAPTVPRGFQLFSSSSQ